MSSASESLNPSQHQVRASETKAVSHTPGPWKVCSDERTVMTPQALSNPDICQYFQCEYETHQVAIEPSPVLQFDIHAELAANARLIAAAPELLAALKNIVPRECPIVTHHRPNCEWCAALKVIAKAEGRI